METLNPTGPTFTHSQKKKDRNWIWVLSAVALSILLMIGSCYRKLSKEGAQSDSAVAAFHKQLDAGECDPIYAEASPELRKAVSLDNRHTICESVPKKMGTYQRSSREFVGFNTTLNGSFINATYASEFSLGKG